jgi:Flp pilus assembly protein TadG
MRVGQGWLAKHLRRFVADRDGAAALEFALVLPPLCLILLGMFEVSMVMFTQASMEGAMREAARYGITGTNASDPAAREGQILSLVDQYTLNLVDMSQATISYQVYGSFNSIDKPEPFGDTNGNGKYDVGEPYTDVNGNGQWDADQGKNGAGDYSQVVQYTVDYDWKLMTPFVAAVMGQNGKVHLRASMVVRNEPWNDVES